MLANVVEMLVEAASCSLLVGRILCWIVGCTWDTMMRYAHSSPDGNKRRFPDFTYITKIEKLTEHLDCVIISHFHLDHCGALLYMSEMVGYDGLIYTTIPTKAICPILLEDYRKITVERKGEQNFFTPEMIKTCMKKVVPVTLHQTLQVDDEPEIKAYYAGHVLGAAMFHVKVGQQSFLYTVNII
ncbi:hypothetical protein ScPMuIL_005162 [Solemya velum]